MARRSAKAPARQAPGTAAEDKLATYRAKRDFARTPEPSGREAGHEAWCGGGHRYLIQKHAARRLHYDFRLELDGTLKSWAVTKGPSLDPADRRLAVHVEDHPLGYAEFEGVIPAGEYGGGTVMLWDRGCWEPVGDPQEGYASGKLKFRLHGERLKGGWMLVRMGGRHGRNERADNWLLIKEDDAAARRGDGGAFLEENVTSVASGRTMEEIASDRDRVWPSSAESGDPEEVPKAAKKPSQNA